MGAPSFDQYVNDSLGAFGPEPSLGMIGKAAIGVALLGASDSPLGGVDLGLSHLIETNNFAGTAVNLDLASHVAAPVGVFALAESESAALSQAAKVIGNSVAAAVETPPKKVIQVYVRLGGRDRDDQRDISFRIPASFDTMDLIENGFAIDGNRAAFTIAESDDQYNPGFEGPFDITAPTLNKALALTQRALIGYLKERGWLVEFV